MIAAVRTQCPCHVAPDICIVQQAFRLRKHCSKRGSCWLLKPTPAPLLQIDPETTRPAQADAADDHSRPCGLEYSNVKCQLQDPVRCSTLYPQGTAGAAAASTEVAEAVPAVLENTSLHLVESLVAPHTPLEPRSSWTTTEEFKVCSRQLVTACVVLTCIEG